ncbi:hypothetical protein NMG60_11030102 [Bertholletia excelsa]
MPRRDTIAWNAMLSAYSQLGLYQETLLLFNHMRNSDTRPDSFSFTATLSACAGERKLFHGQRYVWQVFGTSNARRVFEEMEIRNDVSWCSILFANTNAGQLNVAQAIFDSMPKRVYVAWNTIIAGYAQYGEMESCFVLFKQMLESCGPDQWTLSALMIGWSSAAEANNSILSFYAKMGCQEDVVKVYESIDNLTQVSWNALIDAHIKLGDIQKAFLMFQKAPKKNIISWTSMIAGYARNGLEEQALNFFFDMMRNNIQPDDFTFGAVMHACSNVAALTHGRMVHGCAMRYGFYAYTYVGNALINMYAKCGDIEGSVQAFNEILNKDVVSWNTLVLAYGMHGQASQALGLLEEMKVLGINPDKVTFIGLLMTCSHSGLIEEGRALFESMNSVYGFKPEMDHVACLVDMLGRGGYLEEARDLAAMYSQMERGSISSYETLFGACLAHGHMEMGSNLGRDLKLLEPQNEMSYVLLSNLYCASGQWKEAEELRKAMANQGVKKMLGCSWIQVRNELIAFVAGSHSYPHIKNLHETLYFLEQEMRNPYSVVAGEEVSCAST